MQAVPMSSAAHQGYSGNSASGRHVSVAGQYKYNSPHYAQGDLYASNYTASGTLLIPGPGSTGRPFSGSSSSNQQSYTSNTLQPFGNTSTSTVYQDHRVPDRNSSWQPSLPDQNTMRSPSYAHGDHHPYGSTDGQRTQNHGSDTLFSQLKNESYGPARTPYMDSTSSDRYGPLPSVNLPPASLYSLEYYPSLPLNHPHSPPHPALAPSTGSDMTRCEWGQGHCSAPVEDSSPTGIARHLRQYHEVPVTDNRTRSMCVWGGRCGKDMFPSSLGKHIAECHLRNMTKQCPYCGADFARADTLSRHIKAFCPSSHSPAGLLSQSQAARA